MPIIITPPGKPAKRLDRSRFTRESDLQAYLRNNPQVIPIDELEEDSKLVVLERESPTPVGPIDLLAADQSGKLYIIETKLYRNPDKRQVLAQTLDYGAALWRCADDPDQWLEQLKIRLGDQGIKSLEGEFQDTQTAWDGIRDSLKNGIYNFLILMDEVPTPLKSLILFINENSRFKVYAVELEYYIHDEYQILIPHLFGAESRPQNHQSKNSLRRTWDEASFFALANESLNPEEVQAIKKVYTTVSNIADDLAWGSGIGSGSFNPKVFSISARSLFTIKTNGVLYLNYVWLDDDEHALECQKLFKEKFKSIPPFGEAIEKSRKKYPSMKVTEWMGYTDEFIRILKDIIIECKTRT